MARAPKSSKAKPVTARPRGKAGTSRRRKDVPAPQGDPAAAGTDPHAHEEDAPASSLPFPIAAIGASAGGLEAITEILKALPPSTGMAFVLLQHLSPSYDSMLAEILGRATRMPVAQAENDMEVQPDHVYVIPPGKSLALSGGALQLSPRLEVRGQARPVDQFMRSLAEQHGHKAIGVILSGTGNDGSLGIEEIKAAGGITFAQDSSAEHTGMPRSAVATGAVDHVLAPAAIAAELARLASHPYLGHAGADGHALTEVDLHRALEILRAASGVDFRQYKRNTLSRRITRRMLLNKIAGSHEYVELLARDAGEADALFQDVLINVTSFFRNPEVYETLKATVFPRLTENRARQDQVRIWTLGCSTGEEAYSLAIAYTEYLEASGRRVPLQVFATDLNGTSIERARAGIYGKGIAQDVSPERLRRFFIEVDGSFRIAKPIRDMCVFARQNAIADPPFSRLDMVACRNLLIYLEPSLQQRLLPVLHYALRPEGFLWLGGSETIGGHRDLFDPVDARSRIYVKKGSSRSVALPTSPSRWLPQNDARGNAASPGELDSGREADRILLSRYAPPAVLLDDECNIVQFRGDTSRFLRPAPGKASLNLLKMLREGLMVAVRGAIARAKRDQAPAHEPALRVRWDGGWTPVEITVVPLKSAGVPTMMVLFEEPAHSIESRARKMDADARAALASVPDQGDGSPVEIARLKQEISASRDYLQSVIEQQEAANEELQSANEEVQSANEELQSINEELETSKEEIQSANEELATVNDELQNRNRELAGSNNDLLNLIASVQMPIVMLGADLRIRRFTPAAEKLLNLIPADVGRPLVDVNLNLAIDDLDAVVAEVVESVVPHEREVRTRDGHWYWLRVRPYRTSENRIEGAVVVLVDIDSLKGAEHAATESEGRFQLFADSAPVPIWVNDLAGCRYVNRAFEAFVGVLEADIRTSAPGRFVHPDDRRGYLAAYDAAVRDSAPFDARFRFRRADGKYRWVKATAMPRLDRDGRVVGYVGCTFDVTDMKEAEAALVELDRGKNEFLAMLAHELRNPLAGVRNAAHLLGESRDPGVVLKAHEIILRQTGHMVRMVDDLLDVSRISHGKIQLRLETVDIAEVARQALEETGADRDDRAQAIAAEIPPEPVWVRGDAVRLGQILRNLLDNASKFTRPGGRIWLTVAREETSSGGERQGRASIRVRDDGVGIERAMLPRIFELFTQGESNSERSRSGIGLGLSLAKRLVNLHGGTIEAFSAGASLGSEFLVQLPLLGLDQGQPGALSAPPGRPAFTQDPKRILVVDDNRDAAESMRMMLELSGHYIEVVHEGSAVEAAVASFNPDVVLLDIGLPDLDGYQVARRIRRMKGGGDILVVAVTGYGRDEDAQRSREAGIDLHLTKPIDPANLGSVVGRRRPVD